MEYSMTFLARGVWGSLPMVTMSGPDWTIFSTSSRILRRSMSRFFRTLAATPEPSLTNPSRMCSVPMYSWLKRWASWLASCMTLRARSVKRSYIKAVSVGPLPDEEGGEGHRCTRGGRPTGPPVDRYTDGATGLPRAIALTQGILEFDAPRPDRIHPQAAAAVRDPDFAACPTGVLPHSTAPKKGR